MCYELPKLPPSKQFTLSHSFRDGVSSSAILTVMHVAAVGETVSEDDMDVVVKSASVASQKCLMSISDEGSWVLDNFSHDTLDFLSEEGLDNTLEVNPSGVLAFFDESGVDRHVSGNEAVNCDEYFPRFNVDRVSSYELEKSSSGGISRRMPSKMDVDALARHPYKSVMFDNASGSIVRESASQSLLGMSTNEQFFPNTGHLGGTEYSIWELELIAQRRDDESAGAIVFSVGTEHVPSHSGTEAQIGFGAGRTTYCSSDSARTLLKYCSSGNPPTHFDPHQQLTMLSADLMIQFERAIELDVSFSILGLEDLMMKISSKVVRAGGASESFNAHSTFPNKAGSSFAESVASRLFCSLPMRTESIASNPLPDSHVS